MADPVSQMLRILLVEDNPADARLARELLREGAAFAFELVHEASFVGALARLAAETFDIILLDLSLGDAAGIPIVTRLCGDNPTVPLIVLSGLQDETMAIAAIQQGAQDYMIKGRGDGYLLSRSISYAIERKRIDRLLVEAKQSAEAASHAKSEFLANMSHELRTPLNAILGFAELIQHTTGNAAANPAQTKWQEYARCIHMSGTHLLDIITDILDLSKIEYGRLTLHESPVDIAATIQFVLDMVQERIDTAHLRLVKKVQFDLPPLLADERLVKQALLNLLSNAIKFTENGGAVRIAAGIDPPDLLFVRVEDSGIGIAPDDLARVCEPFVQIESTRSRRYPGTGLGLALTKSILELHDGRLEITSQVGVGTTATLCFPLARTLGPSGETKSGGTASLCM